MADTLDIGGNLHFIGKSDLATLRKAEFGFFPRHRS
jgi:hypothetical protein